MIQSVNDEIRAELRAEIARKGKSMSEVAREIGTSRNQISRMLSAKRKDSIGDIPDTWQSLLDHLGYKIVLEKADESSS